MTILERFELCVRRAIDAARKSGEGQTLVTLEYLAAELHRMNKEMQNELVARRDSHG